MQTTNIKKYEYPSNDIILNKQVIEWTWNLSDWEYRSSMCLQ